MRTELVNMFVHFIRSLIAVFFWRGKCRIYLKSGNVLVLKHVKDFKVTYNGENVTKFNIVQMAGPYMKQLSVDQIEAVTYSYW